MAERTGIPAASARAAGADLRDLWPARMLNEFAYCPRLFCLEWVQGEWRDSVDTVEGHFKHRNVDAETGALPGPGDEGSWTPRVPGSARERNLVSTRHLAIAVGVWQRAPQGLTGPLAIITATCYCATA